MLDYAAVAGMPLEEFTQRVWPAWGMVAGVKTGYGVPEKGWEFFESDQLEPMLARGWTRAFFHRAYPDDSGGWPMDRDGRIEAMKRGESWATGFAPMLARTGVRHADFRAIVYYGSAWDPDFGTLLSARKIAEWVDRHRRSLLGELNLPFVEPGFDHDATQHAGYEREKGGHVPGFPPGAWALNWAWTALVIAAKALTGTRVWIESIIERAAPHQYGCNFICVTKRHHLTGAMHSEWDRSRPLDDPATTGARDSERYAPSSALSGEGLDLNTYFNSRAGDRHTLTDYAPAIARVLARSDRRWHWAGNLGHPNMRASAAEVHAAVVEHAQRVLAGDEV